MRKGITALAVVVAVWWTAGAELRAEVLFPCLTFDECPTGTTCNWGLCEDAMAPSVSRLFQISVVDMPDVTGQTGSAWLRKRFADTLAWYLDQSGLFGAIRHGAAYPIDTQAVFSALNKGSAYVIGGELVSFDGEEGEFRLNIIDAELLTTTSEFETSIVVSGSTMDEVLQKWVNAFVHRFTGRPGILGARLACIKKLGRGVKEVYVLSFGPNDLTQITFDRSLALLPSWTVDGRVAYTSYKDGSVKTYIQGVKEPFTAYPGMNSGLEWARDGSFAAVTLSKDGNPEVYLLEGTTGEERARLTFNEGIDTSPTFSPTGTRIAFVTDRDGTPQLYVMQADGSGKSRLTWSGTYNTNPDWHPFGQYIAYNGRSGGSFQVFLFDVKDGTSRQLTTGPGDCEDPDWSPDGRLIAYSRARGKTREIWVMNPDGSGKRALTEDGPFSSPVWEILPRP